MNGCVYYTTSEDAEDWRQFENFTLVEALTNAEDKELIVTIGEETNAIDMHISEVTAEDNI